MPLLSALLIAVLLIGCARPAENPWGFSVGQFPVSITAESLRIRAGNTQLTGASKECHSCHEIAYNNWQASRHRVAFTNELYHESHTREPSAWCVNCHAPFAAPNANPLDLAQRIQKEDGISCNVCHVRANRVITAKMPAFKSMIPAHDYTIEPQLAEGKFCGQCHEFNFPAAASKPAAGHNFAYSDLTMQGTHSEWKSSGFSRTACQSCHLQGHSFAGGHDLRTLKQALKIEAKRAADGSLNLRIFTLGIGHAFPTGDLFRTLRVFLYNGQTFVTELRLGKRFENRNAQEIKPHEANKYLAEDSVIPAPLAGEFVSMKDYRIPWPATSRELRYELRLDYLHPHNALVSQLPRKLTGITIEAKSIRIPAGNRDNSKG